MRILPLNQCFTQGRPIWLTKDFPSRQLPIGDVNGIGDHVKWALPVVIVALSGGAGAVDARPPLGDPVALNIGISCQWQQQCMKAQTKAMKRSLKYVKKSQPPSWRLQTCNQNAGRNQLRVDWVGFDNCIRNPALQPIPARVIVQQSRAAKAPSRKAHKKPPPRLTANSPPSPPAGPGERG